MSITPPDPADQPVYAPPPSATDFAAQRPRTAGPRTLGVVAFVLAIAAIVVGSVLAYIGGSLAGGIAAYVETTDGTATIDASTLPPELQAQFATGTILVVVAFLVMGVLALWAFIQGIVAAVKNRGRGWAITAIILAVLAVLPVGIFLGIGTAAGLAAA